VVTVRHKTLLNGDTQGPPPEADQRKAVKRQRIGRLSLLQTRLAAALPCSPFGRANDACNQSGCDDAKRSGNQHHHQEPEVPRFVRPKHAMPDAGQKTPMSWTKPPLKSQPRISNQTGSAI
jgi:hypothetical protein